MKRNNRPKIMKQSANGASSYPLNYRALSPALSRSAKLRIAWLSAVVIVLLGTLTVRALRARPEPGSSNSHLTGLTPSTAVAPSRAHTKLRLQPEADRLRRRLGQRFSTVGRELSVLLGTVSLGSERYAVRIGRSQNNDEEQLTVSLNGGQSNFTWNTRDGVRSGNNSVSGSLRALVERLALDSPDQFILAQLRGASYYTVARAVRPEEAADIAGYTGPVWDVIRVAEPSRAGTNRPLGLWRLYYLNTATGLIDKVVSQEQGQPLIAEFSGWGNLGGELAPARVTWKQNNQVVMDLSLSNVTFGPRQ
jgi:hypothetical protein